MCAVFQDPDGWHDISSAPDDGTPILARDGDRYAVIACQLVQPLGVKLWMMPVTGSVAGNYDFTPKRWRRIEPDDAR